MTLWYGLAVSFRNPSWMLKSHLSVELNQSRLLAYFSHIERDNFSVFVIILKRFHNGCAFKSNDRWEMGFREKNFHTRKILQN